MSRLNTAETKWLEELQAVLDRCPSERLGFYTVGDADITVYDRSKDAKITEHSATHDRAEFSASVAACKADFGASLMFPALVHSTSG